MSSFARSFAHGSITVLTGPMGAGKSSALIQQVRRAQIARRRVQIFKHALDERYAGAQTVATHDGQTLDGAIPATTSADLLQRIDPAADVIAIDEAQFFDAALVAVVTRLADDGVTMLLSGTSVDFRGMPFGPMPALLALADEIKMFSAICMECGRDASRNQRLIDGMPAPADGPTILVGEIGERGRVEYRPRCRSCFEAGPASSLAAVA